VKEPCPAEFLEKFPQYPKYIAQLLFNRGLVDQKSIDEFFNADYIQDLHEPMLIKNMDKAVTRVIHAVLHNEKIVVYGDYDADGITSSSIIYKFLKEAGVPCEVYIPDRFKEGYGLNMQSVEAIIKNGANLIITVDCGITDFKEIEHCQKHKVDVVVLDHHLPFEELPKACAVVDLKQKDETYPFHDLCGAGLAFKFICALFGEKYFKERVKEGYEKWLLDLAAIGTVADMVPMIGENRTIVKYGLIVLSQTKWPGLRALLQRARFEKNRIYAADDIGFVISPRINAASRMDHANTSFELLNTDSEEEIKRLADRLEEKNTDRQVFVEGIVKEIEKRLLEYPEIPTIIFEGSKDWSSSVAGLVASRLTEKYNRPSFIYAIDEEKNTARGSCRSVAGFNLVDGMERGKEFLIEYGGHAAASGFHLKIENVDNFKNRITEVFVEYSKAGLPEKCLEIEYEPSAEEVTLQFLKELQKMEPFGKDNEKPLFLMRSLRVSEIRKVGNTNKHTKIKLIGFFGDNSAVRNFSAMSFNSKEKFDDITTGDKIDIVFTVEENTWNGMTEMFFKIKDVQRSQ
jgi:single-stranded-DNA-specific exonuclease